MGAETRKRPAMQSGPGRVRGGTRLCAHMILAPDADIRGVVSFFLHEPGAPCWDNNGRRLCALAALHVYDLMQVSDRLRVWSLRPDNYPIDRGMLATMLCSYLRIRKATAERVIYALVDAGLLAECEQGVGACQD